MPNLRVSFEVYTNYTAEQFAEVLSDQLSWVWASFDDCTLMDVSEIKVSTETSKKPGEGKNDGLC